MSLSEQRTDLTDSYEDFERVMEDYFQVIPPDIDSFKVNTAQRWKYDDITNTITFWFEHEWDLLDFHDSLVECANYGMTYGIDDYDGVDYQELKLTVVSYKGGL